LITRRHLGFPRDGLRHILAALAVGVAPSVVLIHRLVQLLGSIQTDVVHFLSQLPDGLRAIGGHFLHFRDQLLHAVLQLLDSVFLLHDLDAGFKHLLEQFVLFFVYYAHLCVFFFDYPIAALLLLLDLIDKRLLSIC
jgi:hypothetical protein